MINKNWDIILNIADIIYENWIVNETVVKRALFTLLSQVG